MTPGTAPLFQVLAGDPTAEELAAVTTALTLALAAAEQASGGTPVSGRNRWADRATLHRRALIPGPSAWRHSAFPR